MNTHLTRLAVLTGMALTSGTAWAHTGTHGPGGFFGGLLHPLLGVDHLLALFAIGLWAATAPMRSARLPVAVFLCAMLGGVVLATNGVQLPGIETSIAVSVLVGGLLLTSLAKLSPIGSTALIALFALFHGQAHGLEMPGSGAFGFYALGLLVTSGLVLLTATRLGSRLSRSPAAWSLRGIGLLSSMAGAWLLSSI